ncbi:uncharacterized protein [Littorina saxatilis]|uniref:C2H2-type domain-containing protein n=1 Tax=Littorina saxatilis TaxID=31220 RepID=A0AAN9C0I5_9CAEN
MHAKVTILVSKTHWRCLSCRQIKKHMVSIDKHLQAHHGDLLSPLATSPESQLPDLFLPKGTRSSLMSYQMSPTRTSKRSTRQQELGSYSDGEFDYSGYAIFRQKTAASDFTKDTNKAERLSSDEDEKSGKESTGSNENKKNSTENTGQIAVASCDIKSNKRYRPAKSLPKVSVGKSAKHQKLTFHDTTRTTRPASRQDTKTKQSKKQQHRLDTRIKLNKAPGKAKKQNTYSLPEEQIQVPLSNCSDVSDTEYVVINSLVKKDRKKRPPNINIDSNDITSLEDMSLGKVKRGKRRKQPAEKVHTQTENSPSKKKRGRPPKEKSNELDKLASHFDGGQVKKPGLGGRPVTRTLEVSDTERNKLIDSYVITKPQDTYNGAEEASNSLTKAQCSEHIDAPLPSESVHTKTFGTLHSVHAARVDVMGSHVLVSANMNKNEIKNQTLHDKRSKLLVFSEDQGGAQDTDKLSVSNSVGNGQLIKGESDDVIQNISGIPFNDLTEPNVATMLISQSEQHVSPAYVGHQVQNTHHICPLAVNSSGLQSLQSDLIYSGVSSGHLKGHDQCQSLSPPGPAEQIPFGSLQQSTASSDANLYTYYGNANIHDQSGTSFYPDGTNLNNLPVATNTEALPNEGAESEHAKEWLRNKVPFKFTHTKLSVKVKQPSQIFVCKVCQAKYSSTEGLSHHMSRMSSQELFQCRSCLKTFHNIYDLSLHVFGEHEKKKKPCCFDCEEKFQTMEEFERHLNRHLGNQDPKLFDLQFHACQICKEDVPCNPAIMHKHYYRKHKTTVCFECLVRSELVLMSDAALVQDHRRSHSYFCSICIRDVPVLESLEAHTESHASVQQQEDGQGQVCDRCNQWCPNKVSHATHHREHKRQVIRDWRAENWDVGLACTLCGKVLRSKRNLQRHMDQQHSSSRTYKFHCEFCGKGEDCKSALKNHIALHHLGIKRYVCEFCQQSFANGQCLKRHILKDHATDKQYICELCDKKFCEKSKWTKHMFTHTGFSRFMCEHCGKAFHACSDLKRHLSVHLERREFVCQRCWQGFKRKEHLNRHVSKCPKVIQNRANEVLPI